MYVYTYICIQGVSSFSQGKFISTYSLERKTSNQKIGFSIFVLWWYFKIKWFRWHRVGPNRSRFRVEFQSIFRDSCVSEPWNMSLYSFISRPRIFMQVHISDNCLTYQITIFWIFFMFLYIFFVFLHLQILHKRAIIRTLFDEAEHFARWPETFVRSCTHVLSPFHPICTVIRVLRYAEAYSRVPLAHRACPRARCSNRKLAGIGRHRMVNPHRWRPSYACYPVGSEK